MATTKINIYQRILGVWNKCRAVYQKQYYYSHIKKLTAKAVPDAPLLTEKQRREIREYWVSHGFFAPPLYWHKYFYSQAGQQKPEFVPSYIFHSQIRPFFNDSSFGLVWSDKSYLDYFVRGEGIHTVRSVVRNVNGRFLDENWRLITLEQAQNIMEQYESLVIKPATDTCGGNNVKLLTGEYDLAALHQEYKKNYVIQIPLRQHPVIAKLNPSSINTIRVNSVLLDSEAHVLTAFVKVGAQGQFADNQGKERYFIGIDENGCFVDYAIDHGQRRHSEIPSGFAFAGCPVPNFDKVCAMVEEAHKCLPHFGLAFWDVCIQEDGEPAIVEVNLCYPDANVPQVTCGPYFGAYTEQVLQYYNDHKS